MIGLLYMDTANGVAVKLYHSGNTVGEVEINKSARAKTVTGIQVYRGILPVLLNVG